MNSAPIEIAAAALALRLGEALRGAGFLTGDAALEVDPSAAVELTGEAGEILVAAQLYTLQTQPVRALMGSGRSRYVVERTFRLELLVASPDVAWRDQALTDGLTACARLPGDDPSLASACERCTVQGADTDDLAPNGRKILASFAVRVRSSDPLGLTPA